MSTTTTTSGSSDSSGESDEEAAFGLQGYQFEPKRSDTEDQSSGDDSSSSSDEMETEARMENLGWCRCTHCSRQRLTGELECLCCWESEQSRALATRNENDNSTYITNNEDFATICQTPIVLRNVLISLNNIRCDNWDVDPPANRSLRYAAYRQYTWWVRGRLGSRNRRVIPACATNAIRELFSNQPDEQYEGFHSDSD